MSDARSGEAELSAGARARIVPLEPTPEMIAAAWAAFRGDRQGRLIGPGPGFVEAIRAAIAAAPLPRADTPTPHQQIARHIKDSP